MWQILRPEGTVKVLLFFFPFQFLVRRCVPGSLSAEAVSGTGAGAGCDMHLISDEQGRDTPCSVLLLVHLQSSGDRVCALEMLCQGEGEQSNRGFVERRPKIRHLPFRLCFDFSFQSSCPFASCNAVQCSAGQVHDTGRGT